MNSSKRFPLVCSLVAALLGAGTLRAVPESAANGATIIFTETYPGQPVASATQMKATIQWTTDVACDSSVQYGTSPSTVTNLVSVADNVTNHSVRLNVLTPGTLYYYEVISAAQTNNNSGAYYTFTTTTPCRRQ
jgi:hypothetical protein